MFFTEVKIEHQPGLAVHGQKIWTIGSCFANEIGNRMADALFDIRVNPLGTLYNPLSIASAISRVAIGEIYTQADLFRHNGLWHCMDFHSSFSGADSNEVLHNINRTITELHEELPRLRLLMVTFGSARAFINRATGNVAANCHKLPASHFDISDLTADYITTIFTEAASLLRHHAPRLKILYTVSPIRHKAYGFHADRISKANLLIATDRLCLQDVDARYFPAYEIMNDELRDYRFYAADMIHPSDVAANHIYRRFLQSQCDDATTALADECTRFTRRLRHRPLNPSSTEASGFALSTEAEAARLRESHPYLSEAINRYTTTNIH